MTEGQSRTSRVMGVAGVVVSVLGVLVALGTWLWPQDDDPGDAPVVALTTGPTTTGPSTAGPTTPGLTTTQPPAACGNPVTVDGISAAFLGPCQETRIDGAFPAVTVAVPRYPGDGRLVLVSRMLTTEDGLVHERPPLYGQTSVDARTASADLSGPGVWGYRAFVGLKDVCTRKGRAQLLLYLLTPAGAEEARGWRPGVEITIPEGSAELDSVVVTRVDTTC
ncbi:MAG: hypothetical protein HOV94_01495 [Saccharothrix sp.]|nr:hypothetical protein [Saccharothrix sp.]